MTLLSALLLACSGPAPESPSCDEPVQVWPDADGDGMGEPTTTYVGCNPPEGWVDRVAELPDEDTWIWDTGPYVDSGGHSGGSGLTGYTGLTGDTAWWGSGYTGDTGFTGDTGSP